MAFETIFEFSEFTFEFTCKILIHFFINGKKITTLSGFKVFIAKGKNTCSYLHFCSVENETF